MVLRHLASSETGVSEADFLPKPYSQRVEHAGEAEVSVQSRRTDERGPAQKSENLASL